MAGSYPFDPSRRLSLVAGSRPYYFGAGATACNIYTFSSANPDLLSFDAPFTGNIKLISKSPATTGIHPDILAGLQGTFIANEWMQYEADVTAIDYIVDATFNGVVGRFALDDAWYGVDAGSPKLRNAYSLNGINNRFTIGSSMQVDSGGFVEFKFIAPNSPTTENLYLLDAITSPNRTTFRTLATTGNFNRSTFIDPVGLLDGQSVTWSDTPVPSDGVEHVIRLNIIVGTANFDWVGSGNGFAFWLGPIYDINFNNQHYYSVNEGGGDVVFDSIGSNNMTILNYDPAQWVKIEDV